MARLADLGQRRDDFKSVLGNGIAVWHDADGLRAARQKELAEDLFLRFLVAWEFFLSEWFIGAINRDATTFANDLERRLAEWHDRAVKESPYSRLERFFPGPKVTLSKYPSLDEIRSMLDPGGRNVPFRDFRELERRAQARLAPLYARRVAAVRSAGGDELLDAAGAIRNVLAHRSRQSVMEMNKRVSAFHTFAELQKPNVSRDGIGAYLRARTSGAEARLSVYARELGRVAGVLAP